MLPRPTWTALVSQISTELVALLAANGEPPLTPEIDGSAGKIQIGPQFVEENGFPPRVLFVPSGFDFANERSWADRLKNGKLAESSNISTHRAIARQWKGFEVHCWGCNFSDQATPAPDPALDYDAAESLADYVWRACQQVAAGAWRTKRGVIDPKSPTLIRVGRLFVFDLALDTPVTEVPLQLAPSNVKPNPTTLFIPIDGSTPEVGCQG